jgi:hypothetical protein
LLLLSLVWLLAQDRGAERAVALELPALPAPNATCSAALDGAAVRARDAEAAAHSKLLRYPYAPGEGLTALQLLSEAERCFQRAGQPEAARRTRSFADRRRDQLTRDYRAQRLRLQRARQRGDDAAALRELRSLTELLRPAGDNAALRNLRRLELELDGKLAREGQ